jgi:hypothetical protein
MSAEDPKPLSTKTQPAGTSLRINFYPSEFLQRYIETYPNVVGIVEVTNTYVVIYTTMTNNQITTFKNDVFNRVIEIV